MTLMIIIFIVYSEIVIMFLPMMTISVILKTALNQNITLDNALVRKNWFLNLLTWAIIFFVWMLYKDSYSHFCNYNYTVIHCTGGHKTIFGFVIYMWRWFIFLIVGGIALSTLKPVSSYQRLLVDWLVSSYWSMFMLVHQVTISCVLFTSFVLIYSSVCWFLFSFVRFLSGSLRKWFLINHMFVNVLDVTCDVYVARLSHTCSHLHHSTDLFISGVKCVFIIV